MNRKAWRFDRGLLAIAAALQDERKGSTEHLTRGNYILVSHLTLTTSSCVEEIDTPDWFDPVYEVDESERCFVRSINLLVR